MKLNRGVTIVEILVVVGIIGIISAIIFFSFSGLNKSQAVDKAVLTVMSVLNNARSLTLSSKNASAYGVHVEEFQVVLYKGPTYSAGDPNNFVTDLSQYVHVSATALAGGVSDILFKRLTGNTDQTGTITLRARDNSGTAKTITIFSTGTVQSN